MASSLTAQNLKKSYSITSKVLDGINVSFNQGETYAIRGASGSGKSTLLHVVGGLDEPSEGQVMLNEHDLYRMKTVEKNRILNKKIGFVFQFHYLINELSVLENIMLMGRIGGMSEEDNKQWTMYLLNFLGLDKRVNYYPYQLSGGEQQRVSIARALFNKPDFIIADEPTGNLDSMNADMVLELFLKSRDEWGSGVIICSHDKKICEKMKTNFILQDGMLYTCKTL